MLHYNSHLTLAFFRGSGVEFELLRAGPFLGQLFRTSHFAESFYATFIWQHVNIR